MIAPNKRPSSTPHKAVKPQYVEEYNDFLQLFPFRHSYLWAEHCAPGERPDWRTEDRHPLSDRLILQGAFLYGVRFGPTTRYLMLDIDRGSAYHPSRDPFAVSRIVEALEAIGLISYVAVSSSYSGGIHLYFPWGGIDQPSLWASMAESVESEQEMPGHFHSEPQPSWAIAQAADAVLSLAGFKPIKGQLELFPNAKRDGDSSAYNGHRLPLQAGSYLLNGEFEPVFTTHQRFVEQWQFASSHNHVTRQLIDEAIARQPRPWRKLGRTAQKFLNDLNAEIGVGWTGFGQTNNLIGKLVLREYIFGHLFTGQRLRGIELESRVLSIAIKLPGFKHFCKHVLEIAKRISEWCRCVENCPRYYPYGGKEQLEVSSEDKSLSENEKRALEAQQHIRSAVSELIELEQFPASVADRIQAIRSHLKAVRGYGISPTTLYQYKHLWHPHYLAGSLKSSSGNGLHSIAEDMDEPRSAEPRQDEDLQAIGTISFYATSPASSGGKAYGERAVGGSGGFSTGSNPPEGVDLIRREIAAIAQRKAQQRVRQWQAQAETPPDENWFAQMRLSLEVVSDG